MTPTEVMDALDLNDEQFKQVSETAEDDFTDRVFIVEKSKVPEILSDVYLWFRSYSGSLDFGLKSVTWVLDETTDMESIQRDIEVSLGNPTEINTRYSLLQWDSNNKLSQYMSNEFVENMKTKSEYFFQRAENEAAASLIFVNEPGIALPMATFPSVGANAKMIILSSNLTDIMQLQGILQESSS